jgi:hypothetical protein
LKAKPFSPGFRLFKLDIVVLGLGSLLTAFASLQAWWAGFAVAFVVLHFFLFCNVFRISRAPELIWAAVFVALCGMTILYEKLGWPVTIAATLLLTVFLIYRETGKPGYHGICWQKWNPQLPNWWKEKVDTDD